MNDRAQPWPPTQRLVVDHDLGAAEPVATEILTRGGLVVFPTESFYGLGARADSEVGVARLAQVKARVSTKPIPLVAGGRADVERIGPLPPELEPLVEAFWPGPLTVAIPPIGRWPAALGGDLGTLGVRVPDHPIARRLAALGGGLITASSANLAGQEPPIAPSQLPPSLLRFVDAVLDAGPCPGGKPSTVVGVEGTRVRVFRSGAVSDAALARVLGYPVT